MRFSIVCRLDEVIGLADGFAFVYGLLFTSSFVILFTHNLSSRLLLPAFKMIDPIGFPKLEGNFGDFPKVGVKNGDFPKVGINFGK